MATVTLGPRGYYPQPPPSDEDPNSATPTIQPRMFDFSEYRTGVPSGSATSPPPPPPPAITYGQPVSGVVNPIRNVQQDSVANWNQQNPGTPAPSNGQLPTSSPTSYGPVPAGYDAGKWNSGHSSAKYQAGRIIAGGGSIQDVANALGAQVISGDVIRWFDPEVGRMIDIDVIGDVGGRNFPVWYPEMGGQYGYESDGLRDDGSVNTNPGGARPPGYSSGGHSGGSGGPGSAINPNGLSGQVFTDPATAQWEQLVRRLTEMLTTPNPLGYTDSQKDTINTSFLDPMERYRQAELEQARQRMAARGIGPTSGIFEQALQDVNSQFSDLRTEGQRDIALRQVDMEDSRRRENEQRALTGLSTFTSIPALRDSRLAAAQGSLMNMDPYQLLNLQNLIQQQGYQNQQNQSYQDQQFYSYLAQLLGTLFE